MFIHSIPTPVIEQLRNSQFVFHLTGSHYFGVNRPDSDYDFFTKKCPSVETFLSRYGFISVKTYDDILTKTVYRHMEARIDVQLIQPDDIVIKGTAQLVLKQVGITRPTREEWNLMYCLILGNYVSKVQSESK